MPDSSSAGDSEGEDGGISRLVEGCTEPDCYPNASANDSYMKLYRRKHRDWNASTHLIFD